MSTPNVPDADARLVDMLDDEVLAKYPEWTVVREEFGPNGHRMMSPTEPCDRCGRTVFLMLPKGQAKPVWLMLDRLKGTDTLFPTCTTERHKCGDGESWSVEAALFVDAAMREWAVEPQP